MSIDFSALVLAPAMATFGRPVLILPIASQPIAAPYPARGIWTVESINIPTEDGGTFSSVKLKLGIRLADFTIAPNVEDRVATAASQLPLAYWQGVLPTDGNIDFIIDNFSPDGQGGAVLILKRVTS